MDLENYARQVRQGEKSGALDELARSEAGARLIAQVDGAKLEKAAKAGDMTALAEMLRGILSTQEGRDFAAQVQKAVKKDGR